MGLQIFSGQTQICDDEFPMSILSTLSEFLKIKKGGQFFNILCPGIRIVQLRPRTESRDRLSTNQERCPQGSRLPGLIVILDVGINAGRKSLW